MAKVVSKIVGENAAMLRQLRQSRDAGHRFYLDAHTLVAESSGVDDVTRREFLVDIDELLKALLAENRILLRG